MPRYASRACSLACCSRSLESKTAGTEEIDLLRYAIAYVATAAVFFGADYLWLSRAMGFYRSALGDLLAEKPNLVAAAALYLIYFVGIVVFAVMPAAKNDGWFPP